MCFLPRSSFLLLFRLIQGYNEICRQPSASCSASKSSEYGILTADKVIDGNVQQDVLNCSHTSPGKPVAWVQVDLGMKYRLKDITIYYRTESNWKPYRFRQFHLDVSNTSDASNMVRCYTDNTTYPTVPQSIQYIPCNNIARYIRVKTEYDAPEDDMYGAILEVCEMKVYGCEVLNHWPNCSPCGGCANCNTDCHVHCNPQCKRSSCDTNGNCIFGCNPGFWGDRCRNICDLHNCDVCRVNDGECISCKNGFYGTRCENTCSTNCFERTCNKDTGYCAKGCVRGYYGDDCKTQCGKCSTGTCYRSNGNCGACNTGYFGDKCDKKCDTNCLSCEKWNGYCNECSHGFYGDHCNEVCNDKCISQTCIRYTGECDGSCKSGYYSRFCNMTCSKNCANVNCSNDGSCLGGCKENWSGNRCDECDPTHYGYECSEECHVNCIQRMCSNTSGYCTLGCSKSYYGDICDKSCSACPAKCNRKTGECEGSCQPGKFGEMCEKNCSLTCAKNCNKYSGICDNGCIGDRFGAMCNYSCSIGCSSKCDQYNGNCSCKTEWQGDRCDECNEGYYGSICKEKCSPSCRKGTCFSNNGTCIEGCKDEFRGEKCTLYISRSSATSLPTMAISAGLGTGLLMLILIITVLYFLTRRRKHSDSPTATVLFRTNASNTAENFLYSSNVFTIVEDPEEEPRLENPEEAVYYNDLSIAKDIEVSDLLRVILHMEANDNDGFLTEFKMIPYGERFDCKTGRMEENVSKNRFKSTFPYDHSRVILEIDKDFSSDYINANYIENIDGKREFIASQGPRPNTVVDHWRMIWQEHVDNIVMLTNLKEGSKLKCHQYWPNKDKELHITPFSVTLLEEKVYADYVERKMLLQKKGITGSRKVVQFHYTRWPDFGTPDPVNLLVFHRHLRHKDRSQHPILVHCSAGIGRTGTFIAFDVLSKYGKDKGKVNVIEYVKAMRKDRMTMIQNVDQYVFLYHALYEFFRRRGISIRKDEFLSLYGDEKIVQRRKQITNEFNELTTLRPKYNVHEFKTGKKFQKLNFTASVLPVEQYLVHLTSHVQGRDSYYNAVNVSSFTRAEEFISAQYPVPGAGIDLVRLLIDQQSSFLISLTPLSEVNELKEWVDGEAKILKLNPFVIKKGTQTTLSNEIRITSLFLKGKKGSQGVEIFECVRWGSNDLLPEKASTLTNLIKQLIFYRKSKPGGRVTVISMDGAKCCGVFLAVYNAIEQLHQDNEVDMFTIVQQLQCRRPEIISVQAEYQFCFKAVCEYLGTDNVYANT